MPNHTKIHYNFLFNNLCFCRTTMHEQKNKNMLNYQGRTNMGNSLSREYNCIILVQISVVELILIDT